MSEKKVHSFYFWMLHAYTYLQQVYCEMAATTVAFVFAMQFVLESAELIFQFLSDLEIERI